MILITGGTGFIGSYVSRMLVEKGEKPILYDHAPNPNLISDILDRVIIVQGDVLDAVKLAGILKKDVVSIIHLAYYLPPKSEQDPLTAIKINSLGSANVFELARIMDIEKIVYASSIAVYGPPSYYGNKRIDENAERRPMTIYGSTKCLLEDLASAYSSNYGLDTIGLRFGVVYGYGRARTGGLTAQILVDLIENPALNKPVKVPLGDWRLNCVYVKDASRAIILALEKKTVHRILNICGDTTTPREIANYVKEYIPSALIEIEPGDLDIYHPLFDITHARNELGWEPMFPVREGVRDYINMIRAR